MLGESSMGKLSKLVQSPRQFFADAHRRWMPAKAGTLSLGGAGRTFAVRSNQVSTACCRPVMARNRPFCPILVRAFCIAPGR